MEENQSHDSLELSNNLPNDPHQNDQRPLELPENFLFLKEEEDSQQSSSFFSENGLSRDILQVTDAEPDICLEVLYALYNTLWPQLEKQKTPYLRDAWKNCLGTGVSKGILCSPEKLMGKRTPLDIKEGLSKDGGEDEIFRDFDRVMDLIKQLKQKIQDYPDQLIQKEEILASLGRVEGFYQEYRNQVKELGKVLLEASSVSEYDKSIRALENLLEPKAVMMSDIFPNHWAYRIPRKKAQRMLSLDGEECPLPNYSNELSNHRVAALPEKSETSEPLVYFKANGGTPILPEKEFMLYRLYKYLNIPVPETALIILTNVFPGNENYFSAVQASEAVTGSSALEACQNSDTEFEKKAYISQVIGALLTDPSDGSFKNYKYSPSHKTLVGIDNDLVFKPEFNEIKDIKTGKVELIVNVKSVLYLSPFMDEPIPSSVQTYFSSVDSHLMMLLWLRDLDKKNGEYKLLISKLCYQHTRYIYQNLRPQHEQPLLTDCLKEKIFIDPTLHQSSFYPQILISKGLINTLTRKLQKIKTILTENLSTTSQNLFEEISPILGKCYREIRLKGQDPEKMQDVLWEYKVDSNNYPHISALLNDEEIQDKNPLGNQASLYEPGEFFASCKSALISDLNPLDNFLRRHSQRKRENLLDLQLVRKELKLLIQEGFTDLKSPRKAIDFLYDISKISHNSSFVEEIRSLISCSSSAELKWLLTVERYFLRADMRVPKDLRASSLPLLGAFMKQRTFILTESERYYLFDQQWNIKKNASLTGRSRVTYFPEVNPKFYLKQNPEFPGFEYASTLLMRLLGIEHLPYQDLILINKHPVLITQSVEGSPVYKIWEDDQIFKNLDPVHTGLLIIAAMLFNPEDGKEDNFILSPDLKYLVPIDNDHCFLPSTFQKKGGFWKGYTINEALQTKTLLFCLDEMCRAIPYEVKQRIQEVDLLLTRWMKEVVDTESSYTNFVSAEQQNQFYENGTILKIPFYKQFIENLHWKVHKIQHLLAKKVAATPFDLLRAIEPFTARCYESSFKYKTLKDRWNAVTEDLYPKPNLNEPRMSVLGTRSIMEIINIPKEELKNAQRGERFQIMEPADALPYLKGLIQDRDQKTKEEDIFCELDKKNEEKSFLNLFGKSVLKAALEEFFTNPKEGLALKGSKLITYSNLTTFLTMTPSTGIIIRFLSLPESPSLNHECIKVLATGCPNLEYLNVSGCMKLTKIVTAQDEWPLLARLEVRHCLNLEKFVSYSPIQILQIGTDKKIEIFVKKSTLDIFMISLKTDRLDLSLKGQKEFELKSQDQTLSNSNLIHHILSGNKLEHFQNLKLTLGMYSILSEKDLQVFLTVINLKGFNLKTQDIQTISIIKFKNLKTLELSQTGITDLKSLIKGNWPKLNYLDLSGNKINDKSLLILSLGNWPQLQTLILEETDITKKGLLNFLLSVNWPNFKEIITTSFLQDFAHNLLPKNWPFLEELDLSSSNIDKHDLKIIVNRSEWPRLKLLNLSQTTINDEGLEVLTKGDWPLIETLMLKETNVTKKGFLNFLMSVNWQNFKEIITASFLQDFAHNLLPKNWPFLEELDLSSSNIGKHDIKVIVNQPKWLRLKHLNLSRTRINVEGLEILTKGDWPLLETLILEGTRITKKELLNFLLSLGWQSFKEVVVDRDLMNFAHTLLPKNWSLLEELDLSSSNIDKHDIKVMVDRPSWPQLKSLNLSKNSEIRDDGLEILCQGDWPRLEILNLQCTKIASGGIEMFVKKSKWSQLKHLNLSETTINDMGLGILCQGDWPFLETLMLKETNVTKKGFLNFLMSVNWPNFKEIITASFLQDFAHNLLPKNWPFLEELDLSLSNIDKYDLKIVMSQPRWLRLKHLNLSRTSINDERLEILCQGDWPLIEILNLQCTKIASVEIAVLVKKSKWPQLKHLDLSKNSEIRDKGLEILCRGDWPLLETLVLKETSVTKKGFLNFILSVNWPNFKEIITASFLQDFAHNLLPKNWPFLEELDLSSSNIDKHDLKIIVNRSKWPRLKHLNLSRNSINDEGLEIICQGDWPLLEILDIRSTNLTPLGIEVIVKRSRWPQLKHLNLSGNKINDQALEMLCPEYWPLLETLMLKETNVTKKGLINFLLGGDRPNFKVIITASSLQDFADSLLSKNWPFLKELDLSFCRITQNELEIIVRFHFPNLKSLNLASNQISLKELQVLLQGNWPLLENLNLQQTQVTVKEVEEIVNVPNWPRLKYLNLSGNQITNKELAILCRGNWPLLETLDLGRIFIPDKALPLASYFLNANWPNFKVITLDCYSNSVSADICESLVDVCIKKDLSKVEKLDFNELEITLTEFEPILKKNKYQTPQLKFLKMLKNDTSRQTDNISILTLTECPLLQELHLENAKLSLEGAKAIANRPTWLQLKQLNLANNEIFDEGFSALALRDWPKLENLNLKNTKITQQGIKILVNKMKSPNLKKLNISENTIFDEGLKILASAKWPLFQQLVYYKTKVTLTGLVTLLENLQWPDLQELELSFSESFYDYKENSPKIIRSIVLMSDKASEKSQKTAVILNTNWLNSKEIHLSIDGSNFGENTRMLPRDKWDQLEFLELFFDGGLKIEPTHSIVCPRKLKRLYVSDCPLLYENRFESLCFENCPSLEELCFKKMGLSRVGLKNLINKLDRLSLKKLDISSSPIHNEGLKIIASARWRLLESLSLSSIKITAEGISTLVSELRWLDLKILDVSHNQIQDRGLEILLIPSWDLEYLNLEDTGITDEGILKLGSRSNWPNLKELRVSGNNIHNQGLKVLSSIKWPLLENIYLSRLQITEKGVLSMVILSNWPHLKLLDLSENEKIIDQPVSLMVGKWPLLKCLKTNNLDKSLSMKQTANDALPEAKGLSKVNVWPENYTFSEDDTWPEVKALAKGNAGLLDYF